MEVYKILFEIIKNPKAIRFYNALYDHYEQYDKSIAESIKHLIEHKFKDVDNTHASEK